MALDLFEASWDELIGQPSSVSADPEVHAVQLPALSCCVRMSLLSSALAQCLRVAEGSLKASVFFAQDHAERGSLLEAALQKGFVDGVTDWRRSLKGTRFKLIDAVLFNVISPGAEDVLGQARLPFRTPSLAYRVQTVDVSLK